MNQNNILDVVYSTHANDFFTFRCKKCKEQLIGSRNAFQEVFDSKSHIHLFVYGQLALRANIKTKEIYSGYADMHSEGQILHTINKYKLVNNKKIRVWWSPKKCFIGNKKHDMKGAYKISRLDMKPILCKNKALLKELGLK